LRPVEVRADDPGQADPGHRRGEEQPESDVLLERRGGMQVNLIRGRQQGRPGEYNT